MNNLYITPEQLTKEAQSLARLVDQSNCINALDFVSLREDCLSAKPFVHIAIDGMWDEDFLDSVRKEVSEFDDWAGEKQFYGSKQKRWQADWDRLPPASHRFLSYLNQPLILRITEFLTGESGLISDPYLKGGGIHSTGDEGFLKLHADFNWHEKLQLYRRINILVYLNKNWKKEYGGQIELAGKNDLGEFTSSVSLEPIFNRTLIFVTDNHSYHGQPNPVRHPHQERLNSIAAYYYTAKLPNEDSKGKRRTTYYIDEQGKKLKESRFRKIKNKLLRLK